MSINTSHTPDGRGVLIYNGEMILIYSKEVNLDFDKIPDPIFKGKRKGSLYLTSHRIIFTTKDTKDRLASVCMPFHCLGGVKLEQPILGANYLEGRLISQPNGGWEGQVVFKLSFNKGGCIDFGQAMMKAVNMANTFRPYNAPPPYAPPAGGYFSPPPAYYTAPGGNYQGFQAPTQAFPEAPPPSDIYMYESPPPYGGIGPSPPPYPSAPQPFEAAPPSYNAAMSTAKA